MIGFNEVTAIFFGFHMTIVIAVQRFIKQRALLMPRSLAWLENNGVSTLERTLERRLKTWGCNRNTKVPASAIPVSRVRGLFHVNLLSDGEIAAKLAE
jgi:hypothetical protein